jgi:ribosomal protein S18 acetylase RimI-like enzyme
MMKKEYDFENMKGRKNPYSKNLTKPVSVRTGVDIIEAVPEDAEGMTDCVTASYSHYLPVMDIPPGPMLNDYGEMIEKHQAFVIKQELRVIGILVLMLFEKGFLLDNVAVHPEFQGQGLGKMLMDFAEKEARSQGYPEIYLYTHELMTDNIKMYGHLGYVETERRFEEGRPRVYMRKLLLADQLSSSSNRSSTEPTV